MRFIMKNRLLKIGIVLIIALIMCTGFTQATTSYTKFGISPIRTEDSGNYVYAFRDTTGTSLKYIWNVQPYTNETPIDTRKVFYCLAQGYGNFGNNNDIFNSPATQGQIPITTGATSQSVYSGPIKLKDVGQLDAIRSIYASKSQVTAFNEDTIHGLVCILDNMYVPGEENKTTFLSKIQCSKDELLGIDLTGKNVATAMAETASIEDDLTDSDIVIAQQLAIWRLTNPSLFVNDSGEDTGMPKVFLSKDGGALEAYDEIFTELVFEDPEISAGTLREYYVKMIYKNLVDKAIEAQNEGYNIQTGNTNTTISLYANSDAQPIVTVTGRELTGKYDVIIKKVDENGRILQNAEFTVNGTDGYITGADGTVKIASDIQITEANVENTDSYTIVEKSAPVGYMKYNGTITLMVTKAAASDWSSYIINNATLDNTSISSGKVTINKTTNTVTITVVDELEPEEEHVDLALRKFISKVVDKDGKAVYTEDELADRKPTPITSNLQGGTPHTAEYNHNKKAVPVSVGDKVTYTLRVYNEGNVDAYITQITDYLSKYLKYVEDTEWVREYGDPEVDTYESKAETTILTTITGASENLSNYVGKAIGEGVLLPAYDRTNDKLSYIDVQITCEVLQPQIEGAIEDYKMTNIAEITGMADKNKTPITTIEEELDSAPDNVIPNLPKTEQEWQEYKDNDIGKKEYIPGNEDDDDFEKVKLTIPKYDLSLRKFIVQVGNKHIRDEKGNYSREPIVYTDTLKQGIAEQGYGTATYIHPKGAVPAAKGQIVSYIIRVYNEGNMDAYVDEITDYLPPYLEFLKDEELNQRYGWSYDENTRIIKTTITSKTTDDKGVYAKRTNGKLLSAYDGGDTLNYIDVAIRCKVSDKVALGNIQTNIAEITKFSDTKGHEVEDLDSKPNGVLPDEELYIPSDKELPKYREELENNPYVPGQEDDDDYDKVKVVGTFDLALRKFITKVNTQEVDTRYPELSIDNNGNIKYTHTKTPVEVCYGDTVVYTIRVYNEGEIDGYANEITDDVPFGLEFIQDNEINTQYRWKMLDENGQETTDVSKAKYIVTDYLSEQQEKETKRKNLIKAMDKEAGISDKNPDYRDVQIAFKVNYQVKEVGEESRILVNVAQISKDSDDDIDSVPRRDEVYNDKNHEDDIDYENVKVKYFDLSLLKWVTRAIVVENGETKITESGHTGYENPEPDLKVELKTKDVKKVIVKFAYTIKITNEGEIEGYAKEITDYIPQGLEFKQEDNPDWYIRADGVVATAQLEDVLLQPGESAEVDIILTWINGEKNLGRKVNVAEISKDDNPYDVPDIDSTPDNKVPGEDDIDDAPVLLVIKTGTEIIAQYLSLSGIVIAIMGTGIIAIKKFVIQFP